MTKIKILFSSVKTLNKKIQKIPKRLKKTFSEKLAKDSLDTEMEIKKSVNTISPGSRPVRRFNPTRIALSSPIGVSPNTDLGRLVRSITSDVTGMFAEIGTVGAFDQGINYANVHEEGGRKYIYPQFHYFNKRVQRSANKSMLEITRIV